VPGPRQQADISHWYHGPTLCPDPPLRGSVLRTIVEQLEVVARLSLA
jgi:hypothetical protein